VGAAIGSADQHYVIIVLRPEPTSHAPVAPAGLTMRTLRGVEFSTETPACNRCSRRDMVRLDGGAGHVRKRKRHKRTA
jgi:hypothetical protein